jgi:hypothetical protein
VVHVYAEGATRKLTAELADEAQAQIEAIVQGQGLEERTEEKAST